LSLQVILPGLQRSFVFLDDLLLAPRLLFLVAFVLLVELFVVFGPLAELDGLGGPLAGGLKVPRFGVATGESAQDMRLLVLGQLAGLLAVLDGFLGVADHVVLRGSQ